MAAQTVAGMRHLFVLPFPPLLLQTLPFVCERTCVTGCCDLPSLPSLFLVMVYLLNCGRFNCTTDNV